MDKTTSSVLLLLNDFHLKLKNIIWLFLKAYFDCFAKGHIHNVVSTLPNVVKPNVENSNVVSTFSDVVHIDVEVHNVVSTLIWGCSTSRRRINLKTTLNRRWNVCWVVIFDMLSVWNWTAFSSTEVVNDAQKMQRHY